MEETPSKLTSEHRARLRELDELLAWVLKRFEEPEEDSNGR